MRLPCHQPLRVVGTHTDITERRSMEEALRASLAEVKRHDGRMIALNRMNDRLLSCETREEAYCAIARSARRLFAGWSGGLAVLADGAPELRVVATWGDAQVLQTTFLLYECWALRRGEIHEITDPSQSAQCQHFSSCKFSRDNQGSLRGARLPSRFNPLILLSDGRLAYPPCRSDHGEIYTRIKRTSA